MDQKQDVQRIKHNYTSELELKSLLIRTQNWNAEKQNGIFKLSKEEYRINRTITRYLRVYNRLSNIDDHVDDIDAKYKTKVNKLKRKLKERIIKLSEMVQIDTPSYERFGETIMLMIKNILKKHQFSGYSYRDDFYSDAIHKILKYLHNFDHTLISQRSGQEVNAFAYISQIIHNSVIFIIKQKNKEQENIKDVISLEIIYGDLDLKQNKSKADMFSKDPQIEEVNEYKVKIDCLEHTTLKDVLIHLEQDLAEQIKEKSKRELSIVIEYPSEYRISMEEYNELRPLLKGHFSIVRAK